MDFLALSSLASSGSSSGSGDRIKSTGTAPTVATNDCGSTTQGTITAGSTDVKGEINDYSGRYGQRYATLRHTVWRMA